MFPTSTLMDYLKCDRVPEGTVTQKSPGDGRFRIRIEGNPEGYIAGEDYTSEFFYVSQNIILKLLLFCTITIVYTLLILINLFNI